MKTQRSQSDLRWIIHEYEEFSLNWPSGDEFSVVGGWSLWITGDVRRVALKFYLWSRDTWNSSRRVLDSSHVLGTHLFFVAKNNKNALGGLIKILPLCNEGWNNIWEKNFLKKQYLYINVHILITTSGRGNWQFYDYIRRYSI
jgi:hypothetical protein